MESLEPWARSSGQAPEEQRLARLFGAVAAPEELNEAARARVRRRLLARAPTKPGLLLARLVAVGVVLGVVGAAAAQWAAERLLGARSAHFVPPPAPSRALAPQPVLPRVKAARRPTPEAVVEEPATEPLAPLGPRGAAPPPSSAVARSSRLGLEASSLEAALKLLKRREAQPALDALDRHLQAFPSGALELEARVARLDAELMLGRRQAARRTLASLPLDRVGRKQELLLLRAELTADEDCGGALADFHTLNQQALPSAWAERALFGRGACLLELGDVAGAERDFASYLERFPNGRFAARLRAR